MPQALGAVHVLVSRMTAISARARAGEHLGGHLLNPSVSSQAFVQMAAEQPMMHPPQDKALEGARKTWRHLAGQNLLPRLIANGKFKDRIEASPPQAITAA